jgi:hypothetical protein
MSRDQKARLSIFHPASADAKKFPRLRAFLLVQDAGGWLVLLIFLGICHHEWVTIGGKVMARKLWMLMILRGKIRGAIRLISWLHRMGILLHGNWRWRLNLMSLSRLWFWHWKLRKWQAVLRWKEFMIWGWWMVERLLRQKVLIGRH